MEHLTRQTMPADKQEKEMTQKNPNHFQVVPLIFWGCLNNYFCWCTSYGGYYTRKTCSLLPMKAAISTPPPLGEITHQLLIQSNQPPGSQSSGEDSRIKSSVFCMHVTVGHTGESGRLSKANTGADGLVYSALSIGSASACALFSWSRRPHAATCVSELKTFFISHYMRI